MNTIPSPNTGLDLPLHLTVSYGFAEWLSILRDAQQRGFRYWLDKLLVLPFFLIGVYELLLGASLFAVPTLRYPDGAQNLLYGILLVVFAIIMWTELISIVKIWFAFRKRSDRGQKQFHFTFGDDEAGYEAEDQGDRQSVSVSWSSFESIVLGRTAFILRLKDGGFWAIPRRVFSSIQDAEFFQNFVQARLAASKLASKQ